AVMPTSMLSLRSRRCREYSRSRGRHDVCLVMSAILLAIARGGRRISVDESLDSLLGQPAPQVTHSGFPVNTHAAQSRVEYRGIPRSSFASRSFFFASQSACHLGFLSTQMRR